ncbi:MAG: hypothetical protein KC457_03355 [Myxococcales bacterium]|nr:hypothetical protein [Myxococcales bacterium]
MSRPGPTRERHHACIHPLTYKYFFRREQVGEIWALLGERYGELHAGGPFGIMEIRSERLILRATMGGNPITVIRTRHCTRADVEELHRLIGFVDDGADEA